MNNTSNKIRRIDIGSWYILGGVLCGDVKIQDIFVFKQYDVIKYDGATNKVWLIEHIDEVEGDLQDTDPAAAKSVDQAQQVYGAVLDWGKVDKWFIINNNGVRGNRLADFKNFLLKKSEYQN